MKLSETLNIGSSAQSKKELIRQALTAAGIDIANTSDAIAVFHAIFDGASKPTQVLIRDMADIRLDLEREKAITSQREQAHKSAKADLMIGMCVTFNPRKTKPAVTGIIKSINDKTVTIVNCSDGPRGWRVPADMLTAIE